MAEFRRIAREHIMLPWFEHEDGDAITVRDALSLDYANRYAVPILSDVSGTFEDAVKERAREDAARSVGFLGELIEGTFTKNYDVGRHRFQVSMYRSEPSASNKTLVDFIAAHLESLRDRPLRSLGRRVSTVGDERYADVKRLIDDVDKTRKTGEPTTKTKLQHLDQNDAPMTLDDSIREMEVHADLNQYRPFTPANADAYHRSKSLEKRIKTFVDEAKERIFSYYGTARQTKGDAIHTPLDEDWSLRILPYERSSTSYAKIVKSLLGHTTATGAIAASTGDLTIIAELGAQADYTRAGRGSVQVISTPISEEVSTVSIVRDGTGRHYRVSETPRGPAVAVPDVIDQLNFYTREHTDMSDQIKYDFLAPIPAYLRR